MKKISDYIILEDTSSARLALSVKEHLEAGWQPLGGIAVYCYKYENTDGQATAVENAQAMVK